MQTLKSCLVYQKIFNKKRGLPIKNGQSQTLTHFCKELQPNFFYHFLFFWSSETAGWDLLLVAGLFFVCLLRKEICSEVYF